MTDRPVRARRGCPARVASSFARTQRAVAAAAFGAALTAWLLPLRAASAQEIGLSLVPSAQRISWNDRLPLLEDWMYGGRLGLQFGQWVELQPFYFQGNGFRGDSARGAEALGEGSVGRRLDLRHYGTNVQVNLSRGGVVPFVRAGAGVMRFEPEERERQDRIALTAGGGLRLDLGGVQGELFAERLSFRLDPLSLYGNGSGEAPTLSNLSYGAGLVVPLSQPIERAPEEGLRGSTAPIEPFVGRLQFDDALGLSRTELVGVRAGIDFSPVFGVRGFYWRGVNDDRDGPGNLSGYGGEAQFTFNGGPGLAPFLVVGAGTLDFARDFRDSAGNARADKSVFILGAGASLRLGDRVRLNGAIRDYIMTAGDDLDAVATTGDLTHNPMVTAGFTLSLGGRSAMPARSVRTDRSRDRAWDEIEAARAELRRREARLVELEAERSGVVARGATPRLLEEERVLLRDSVTRDVLRRDLVLGAAPRVAMPTTADGTQWITVPVPVQGEIILRFGPTARSGDSTIVVTPVPGDEVSTRLGDIERRLNARLDAMQRGQTPVIVQPTPAPGLATPNVTVINAGDSLDVRYDLAGRSLMSRFGQVRTRDIMPYAGVSAGRRTQLVAGLRADLGPLSPGSGLHFVPELALGVGERSPTILALANARYAFGSVSGNATLRPHVTLGAGIYTPSVIGINTAVGTSVRLQREDGRPLYLHMELQGLNLFSQTRLLFGLSRSR
jgi:hypothetical protein